MVDGFHTQDIAPGMHVLAVDMSGLPGACEAPIDVAGGNSYFYKIVPRPSYWHAALPGQVIFPFPLVGLVVGPVAIYAGTGIETAGKACGGGFSIESVDRDEALPKLVNLHSLN